MKDKNTGKSRGFGYITMKDSMVIEKILSSKPIFINEHKIDCKIAIPKEFISEGKPEQKVPQFNPENELPLSKTLTNFLFFIIFSGDSYFFLFFLLKKTHFLILKVNYFFFIFTRYFFFF